MHTENTVIPTQVVVCSPSATNHTTELLFGTSLGREALVHGDKLEVFNENRRGIEQRAREKYLAGDTQADGSILIRTGDL